ncbi:alpha/beta hydrolase [Acidicapsa ligni]|uniref:alpha/beta hydrolase n=1 Tax=Acidicapsa ligni TaxID=542300 RepID=UPI0021DFE857|nr:alpha/beta family hydrolase [Acidicapsa ligni]
MSDTIPAPAAPTTLRSFYLAGPAGRLEALLNEGSSNEGSSDAPSGAPFVTLISHPHPLGGGTMHNKVVYHAAKVFSSLGWPVLRFNFRGTGLSEGQHNGHAEFEDVRAGLDWLTAEYRKPIVAAGFSFGAAMGLKATIDYPGIAGFAALGLPTHAEGRDYSYKFLPSLTFPKLFLSGDRDQYAPADQLRTVAASASEPKQLALIPNADHFFVGQLEPMQAALRQWLQQTFLMTPNSGESAQ